MNVEDRAKQANGRSRACARCRYVKRGSVSICNACSAAFVEGYKRGWKEHAYQSKRRARGEYPENNQDEQ